MPSRRAVLAVCAAMGLGAGSAQAQDKVRFGLDWLAEAEYGGYYQAVATGIYARHGLDVIIEQGGPQVNQAQKLLAGRLDFTIASNSILALNFASESLPFTVVAALFQKDPSAIITHPGTGNDNFAALRGKPIMIGADTRSGWWNFVKSRFGYSDDQIRPYTFNLAPFLADKAAIQQGYVTSEPFLIQQQAGFKPDVLLLADAGFSGYASLIATSTWLIENNPDLVQRFVDATIEGWHSYLHDDPSPANMLIKKDNPEMTDALLTYGRNTLKARGIVESGDASRLGIGAMTDARWKDLFDSMATANLYPRDLDYRRAYTLRFVNHRIGLESKP
jgi:NitT/TauT family transport system substrate-binding protein